MARPHLSLRCAASVRPETPGTVRVDIAWRKRNRSPVARRKLPIGIQTFRTIREEGCYYVDKTAYVWKLVKAGTHYLLSLPRLFGKSLLVDTLKELSRESRNVVSFEVADA